MISTTQNTAHETTLFKAAYQRCNQLFNQLSNRLRHVHLYKYFEVGLSGCIV